MADVCKVGDDFFLWSSALECKDALEKATGKPHHLEQGIGIAIDSQRNLVKFVYEGSVNAECRANNGIILFSKGSTKHDAQQCAQTLSNLSGIEYYTALVQQTGLFSPDVYAVLKK